MKPVYLLIGIGGLVVIFAGAGAWWFFGNASPDTSDRQSSATTDLPSDSTEEDEDPWASLSAREWAGKLKETLAWTRGMSPEELAQSVLQKGNDVQEDPWLLLVVRASFVDSYGDQAEEKLQAFYQELYKNMDEGEQSRSARERMYGSESERQQSEILELAVTDCAKALEKINSLDAHPKEIESLQVRVIGKYAESEPLKALALLKESDNIDVNKAQLAIFQSWAENDPQAGFDYLAKFPASYYTEQLRATVLTAWAQQDVMSALEAAINSPVNVSTNNTLKSIVAKFLEQDPEGAIHWVQQQEVVDLSIVEATVMHLAKLNSFQAYQLMAQHLPYSKQKRLIDDIIREASQQGNTQASLQWIGSLPEGALKMNAQQTFYYQMVESDPDAIVSMFIGGTPPPIKASMLRGILRRMGSRHPEKALSMMNALPPSPLRAVVFGEAMSTLIRKDPGRIGEFLGQMREDPYLQQKSGMVMDSWFDSDFDAATRWMKNNTSQPGMQNMLMSVADDWLEKDLEGALKFGTQLPAGDARATMASRFVNLFAERNLKSVVDWFSTFEPDSKSDYSLSLAFSRGGLVQKDLAMQLLETMPKGSKRDYALTGMADGMADTDPEQASYWMVQQDFSSEKSARNAANRSFRYWHRKDPQEATQWVLSLPDGQAKSAAASTIAIQTGKSDPAQASKLVRAVSDAKTRHSLSCNILRGLPDRNARVNFINQLALAPEETSGLYDYMESRGL